MTGAVEDYPGLLEDVRGRLFAEATRDLQEAIFSDEIDRTLALLGSPDFESVDSSRIWAQEENFG